MLAQLTEAGCARVLRGRAGMEFYVDKITPKVDGGSVAHVRDSRYPGAHYPWQIWSLVVGADRDCILIEGS